MDHGPKLTIIDPNTPIYSKDLDFSQVAREQAVRQAFAHGNPKVVINCVSLSMETLVEKM